MQPHQAAAEPEKQEHDRGMKRRGEEKTDGISKQEKRSGRQLEELTGSANRVEGRGQQEASTQSKDGEGTYTWTQYNVVANHGKETALHRSHA